jgi:hypothetical protein
MALTTDSWKKTGLAHTYDPSLGFLSSKESLESQ